MNKGEQEKVFLLCTAKAKTTIILILVILVEHNMDCNLRASEVPMVFQQTFPTTGTLSLYELDYSALFHTTKTCNPLSSITNQRKLTWWSMKWQGRIEWKGTQYQIASFLGDEMWHFHADIKCCYNCCGKYWLSHKKIQKEWILLDHHYPNLGIIGQPCKLDAHYISWNGTDPLAFAWC